MTWAFGGNHDDVDICTWYNLVVMHVETVGKCQSSTSLDVGGYFFVVDIRNVLVRQQNHDHIRFFHGVGHFFHFQARAFGFGPGGTALAQANNHFNA